MVTGRISKTSVDEIEAGPRDQFLWDDKLPGFGLKVTPNGRKVYVLQFRLGGGRSEYPKRYRIGEHGRPYTPDSARKEAERLWSSIRQGANPIAEKHARAVREKVDTELGFDVFADRFLRQYVKVEWAKSYRFAEGILRNHLRPAFKGKGLPEITRADILALLDGIAPEKVALRRNVFAVTRKLFRWAIGRGIEKSPLDGVDAPPPPKSRDRTLEDDELKQVWLATLTLPFPEGPIWRCLIATGQRRKEIGGMAWDELDRARAEWLVPKERSKNGVATVVPLSGLMVGILDELAGGVEWPRSGLVLSSNGRPFSSFSGAKHNLDAAIAELVAREANGPEPVTVKPWRLHDLRRTLATNCQRLGVRFEVTEAILNHLSGSKSGVAGVYQRYHWAPEKRAALDTWAAHLQRVLTGDDASNVISLTERRAS